ncbi:hypothetical protein EYF80_011907 [Liparis tanakae]|uniref:Uncharacterized protein n=1 Tax=Liparis tanakae TaxID=230148 RepID=A0A4Z2IIL3_9TELE|nr:hypothetical protein EYF80_011907 [Liparis tanakae]
MVRAQGRLHVRREVAGFPCARCCANGEVGGAMGSRAAATVTVSAVASVSSNHTDGWVSHVGLMVAVTASADQEEQEM